MKTKKTITGRELKVTSNKSLRHFTIKTENSKFRTLAMSQEEFDSNENNTGNDWQQFLNSCSGDYYLVK